MRTMDDDLPVNYDAIIVGTGFIESVVAAAISRIGKSVLHIDSNDFYGENWASFSLDGIESWTENNLRNRYENKKLKEKTKALIGDDETLIHVRKKSNIANLENKKYIKDANSSGGCSKCKNLSSDTSPGTEDVKKSCDCVSEEPASELHNQDVLYRLARKFNLDLCPKLIYSKGPMVELLISSNVAKYAEFKSLNRVLTWRNDQLEHVPCSRSDVFATKNVSVVQKRMLVKILTLFANYTANLQEFNGFENRTFLEFLEHKKLPPNLIHYILFAIAMGDKTTPCLEGVKSCKAFLESLGRFGNTPFIFPMYGSGELPQCFCRLSAVFGGIYCLNRCIEALILKDDHCSGLISNGVRLNADKIVISSSYHLENYSVSEDSNVISRAILITDSPLLKTEKDPLTLLQFPPISHPLIRPVTVIQLASGTFTCPDDLYVVHLTSVATESASVDFKPVLEALFDHSGENPSKPRILWSLTWNFTGGMRFREEATLKNVRFCRGADAELDYDQAIQQAREIFNELYPGEEFLPRAPDPDEIVLESPQESGDVHGNSDEQNVTIDQSFSNSEADFVQEPKSTNQD